MTVDFAAKVHRGGEPGIERAGAIEGVAGLAEQTEGEQAFAAGVVGGAVGGRERDQGIGGDPRFREVFAEEQAADLDRAGLGAADRGEGAAGVIDGLGGVAGAGDIAPGR
jgi:hypothetical protein